MRYRYTKIHEGRTRRALDAEQRLLGRLQAGAVVALILFAFGWAGRMDMDDALAAEQAELERSAQRRLQAARALCVERLAADPQAEAAAIARACARPIAAVDLVTERAAK